MNQSGLWQRIKLRRVARLAVLAMLLQLMAPLLMQPAAAAGLDGAVPICHAGGNAFAPDRDQSPAGKAPVCPICAVLQIMGAGFLPPDSIAVAAPPTYGAASAVAPCTAVVAPWIAPSGQPRAPPAA